MKTEIKITKEKILNLIDLIDCGLIMGAGTGKRGDVCVEQAISVAIEGAEPWSEDNGGEQPPDRPKCVDEDVAQYKIILNDRPCSSNKARGKILKAIAIAQLGSNIFKEGVFSEALKRRLLEFKLTEAQERLKKKASLDSIHNWIYDFEENVFTADTEQLADNIMLMAPKSKNPDVRVKFGADIGLEVLKELKSPGCKYLHLLENKGNGKRKK